MSSNKNLNNNKKMHWSGPEHITVSEIILACSHTSLTLYLVISDWLNIISADVDNNLTEFMLSLSQHFYICQDVRGSVSQ